jgi:hypothetical protein
LIATGATPPALLRAQIARELEQGRFELDAYVDGLVNSELFIRKIAPRIFLRSHLRPSQFLFPNGYVLKRFRDPASGIDIHYLREPCDPTLAESVRPWWEPEHPIRICPDSYRPRVLADPSGNRACGGLALLPESSPLCGCGPSLVFCTRDAAHQAKMKSSAVDELLKTAAYVVGNDLPIEQLVLSNETFRDRNAELIYRRWRIANGEQVPLSDLASWPVHGQLVGRYESFPGQHAGILTTPQLLFRSDALRSSIKHYFELLWCTGISSSRVDTHAVLSLDATDLRVGDGWQKLASMPICSRCHARLDYGMQFFSGYPSAIRGLHFMPALHRGGSGPLYGEALSDHLGDGPLTPAGFASLAVQQPEFLQCMARKVTDFVFRGADTAADYGAILQSLRERRTVKAAMRTALLRFAASGNQVRPVAERLDDDPAPLATEATPEIPVSTRLRGLLHENCGDCHGSEKSEGGRFDVPRLPRSRILGLLNAVSFGTMPPGGLDPSVRRRLIEELTALIWTNESIRPARIRYFANGMKASSVYDLDTTFNQVHARAGAGPRGDWVADEQSVEAPFMRYTPGFAAIMALEALRSCKESHPADREGLRRCFERSSAPASFVLDRR